MIALEDILVTALQLRSLLRVVLLSNLMPVIRDTVVLDRSVVSGILS